MEELCFGVCLQGNRARELDKAGPVRSSPPRGPVSLPPARWIPLAPDAALHLTPPRVLRSPFVSASVFTVNIARPLTAKEVGG